MGFGYGRSDACNQCASWSINEQDVEKYLKTVKFPFTYQNHTGVSITIESADDYRKNFDFPWKIIRKTEPNWSHSALDNLEEVARSASSVAYKFLGSRISRSGDIDVQVQAIWIAVLTNGTWGVQFRHNLGVPINAEC